MKRKIVSAAVKPTSHRLPPRLLKWLKHASTELEMTQTDIVIRAVTEHLEKVYPMNLGEAKRGEGMRSAQKARMVG